MLTRLTSIGLVAIWILAGCGGQDQGQGSSDPSQQGKEDQWGHLDAPSKLHSNLEYQASELPMNGVASKAPWPGSYWPVYRDSINDRWDGPNSLSPAEKYALAFGVDDIEDRISKRHGVDSYSSGASCTSGAD